MPEVELRALCRELIGTAWPAFLSTVDREGNPRTRAMFNLRNKERFPSLVPLFEDHMDDFMTLFSTNTSSSKVADVESNPVASVYYCRPEESRGLMLGGRIEIVSDPTIKRTVWHDGWERYYPQGYDDPDHTVLRLIPRVARGWNQSSKFQFLIEGHL